MISGSGISGAGSAMALDGMQGTCFDYMRSSSFFSAHQRSGAAVRRSDRGSIWACVVKGERVPHSCLS